MPQATRDHLRAAMARHEQGDAAASLAAARRGLEVVPEDLLASILKEDIG